MSESIPFGFSALMVDELRLSPDDGVSTLALHGRLDNAAVSERLAPKLSAHICNS